MAENGSRTWGGFLVMAFVVLGLCGVFATYAAQLPFQRELFAESRLDTALASRDPAAQLDRLRDQLGDDGSGAFPPGNPPGDDVTRRIAFARRVLRQHFQRQAADIALRLRIVIVVFTGAAALFGLMVVSVLRRAAR